MDSEAELFDDEDDGHVEDTFLTFHVADEEYAVPVLHVTEIVRLQKIYAMPDVPEYIRGVINLRGKVIPLLDVRARFGLSETSYTDRTVVVVLELEETLTGLVVDGVSEVVEIAPADIEPAARSQNQRRKPMVKGLGKREQHVCFILDVNALLDTQLPSLEGHPAAQSDARAVTQVS